MAGTLNAGSIVYEVDMDTARLLAARREVDAALNGMGANMGRLDASVTRTERSLSAMQGTLSSLTGVAKGLIAALSVQQVAEWGNEWVTVNNKLANSVRATEQLSDVTQRVFDISQNTMSSLQATATLYGRLERATRSAGTSTQDLITLTSTINKGLAVSGATTEEASSAMTQLSQALASGVLRGEEFNSISENGSRLAVALADSLGVTIGQLRAMAAQGKLTTEVVVNGLLQQSDAIAKEFSNTAMTMGQALTVATNNITKFVGESSSFSTTINVFNKGVISVSENLESVAQAVGAAALVFGGRFVGALALATQNQAKQAAASISQAVATRTRAKDELAAALVTQRKTMADRGAAESALNLALMEYQVAKGSAAEATALANVIRLRTAYTEAGIAAAQANNIVSASQARLAATGLTAANAMKAINLVTSPLGGPLGVIAIVAAGWYLYAQKQEEARKASIEFANSLPSVISKLKEMNLVQAQGVRADTITSIKNQEEALVQLNQEIAELSNRYKDAQRAAKGSAEGHWLNSDATVAAAELENELAKKIRDRDSAQRTLTNSQEALRLINIQVNQSIVDQMKAARDNALALAEAEKKASFLGKTQSFLASKLGASTEAMQKFNAESLKINWGGTEGEKLIKQAERRLALSKLEGDARQKLQARYDAEDAGVTDPKAIERLQEVYVKTNDAKEAIKEKNKEDRAATAESKKAATQAENVAQKLERLKQQSELAADSTKELSREQTILRAQQSLGKGATEEQIQQAGEYAAKAYDTAKAVRELAQAEQGRKFAKQEVAAAQVMPDAVTGAVANPMAQIDQQEQQKLAALAKYQAIDVQNAQLYEDAKTAIQQQAANARKQIIQDELNMQNQAISSILGSVSQGFDGLANLAAGAAGKSSGAYQAMFALSKGFAVAQAALNLQLAISQALADPTALTTAQKFANYASIAAAGGSLLSTIGSISMGGAREHGGPVNANSMYRVGEGGKPEIFKASNGSQYMIPGDKGKVISNSDLGGAGGGGGVIEQHNYFTIHSATGDPEELTKQIAQISYQQSLRAMKDQQRPGGMLRQRK